ncbi:DUF2071 domain-containing protein [Burkholderia sp. Ax-1719]|uniref:DUF2071 domain-containing protein n=1 Tax=Burkholderia sp. Ax-1719 TaxID=2608334 RepID=UPI00142222B3|nr:DUF2071 domain-containing protein [Burkholderia sp. Ax-1719]NIE63624.1 hypothetical protein [Burkholderia sp. Ax-1719]
MFTNEFVSPSSGFTSVAAEKLINCRSLLRARRAVLGRLPFPTLASDVVDIVYCTWSVDLARIEAARLVPPGVELAQRDGKTLFTILTYAHRHFGPALAGPLRRLFPSPLQSNWRFYVDRFDGANVAEPTVLFVKNVVDQWVYAIGSRVFSDALPSHLPERFEHCAQADGYSTLITGGRGSAPGFRCDARRTSVRAVPAEFGAFFGSWDEAVAQLCLQDAALSHVEDCGRLAHARIDLPIDLRSAQPLEVAPSAVGSAFLDGIGATGSPFCFVIPGAPFRVISERLI